MENPNFIYEGETVAWFTRWLIEQNIEGYGRWCLERYWLYHFVDYFVKEGYSKNLVIRAIVALKKDTSVEYYEKTSIKEWIDEHKHDPSMSEDLPALPTTSEITLKIINTSTHQRKIVYSDLINPPHKGKATHFVSHSWGYPIWSLVEGLIMHQLNCDRGVLYVKSLNEILEMLDEIDNPNYYWIDIFNKNQHVVNSSGTILELARCIKELKHTVLILHPSDRWALSRVWCLFEVLNTLQSEAKMSVALSFRFIDVLEDQRIEDLNQVPQGPSWTELRRYQAFQKIDVRTAEASIPEDKELIFKKIEESVGFDLMNERVLKAIEEP